MLLDRISGQQCYDRINTQLNCRIYLRLSVNLLKQHLTEIEIFGLGLHIEKLTCMDISY